MIEAVFPNTSINQPTEKNMLEFLSSLIASLIGPVISRIPNKAELPHAFVIKYDSRGDRLSLLVKVVPGDLSTDLLSLEIERGVIFDIKRSTRKRQVFDPPSKRVDLGFPCRKASKPLLFWVTTEKPVPSDVINFVIRTNYLLGRIKFSFKPLNAKP